LTRIEDLHEKADVVSSLNIVIEFKKNTKEGSYYKMNLSNSLFFFLCVQVAQYSISESLPAVSFVCSIWVLVVNSRLQ